MLKYSTVTNKRHLYDSHTKWRFDGHRTGLNEQGIVAFVTNGSWIDANVDAGVRACLAEEFSSIYVLHLRGNTSGPQGAKLSRREGGQGVWLGIKVPVHVWL